MKFSFEVGEHERHTVSFAFDQVWGSLQIEVDGVPVRRDLRLISRSLVKRYEITVGQEEVHEVLIEKERKFFFAGFRRQKYRALIDGRLILAREGY